MGRYIFTPEVFDAVRQTPEDNRQKEKLLTESICILSRKQVVYIYEIPYEDWYTVGDPVSQMITSLEFASKDPKLWPEIEKYLKENIRKSNQKEDDLL